MKLENSSDVSDKLDWNRFCEFLWFSEKLDFWLDISKMNVSNTVIQKYQPLFARAFEAMQRLESGERSNINEDRQVGHYWLRDPHSAPDDQIQKGIENQISSIEVFCRHILDGSISPKPSVRYTDVLWIGIGGSGLGPLLIVNSLKKKNTGLNFHFIDNVDPDGFSSIFEELKIRFKSTLFVVVSKSGGTPEPRIAMDQARHAMEKQGLLWSSQSIAITMIDSHLYRKSKAESWLKTFELQDWVGGRTSITGSVGLLSLGLVGGDIRQFLNGASVMDNLTRNEIVKSNPSALMAISWFQAGEGKGKRDLVILPYRDKLDLMSRYLQQLIMESLGKKLDRDGNLVHQGISVYGNKGSTDQHAYVQQLRDGVDNFFVTFIEVLSDSSEIYSLAKCNPGDYLSGFLQGTRTALSQGGRQSITITLKSLNERSLGALVALFERSVGLYAELININAYDQPGVEAGKKAAADILDMQDSIINRFNSVSKNNISQINDYLGGESHESIYFIMRHLVTNDKSYTFTGDWSDPASLEFTKLL